MTSHNSHTFSIGEYVIFSESARWCVRTCTRLLISANSKFCSTFWQLKRRCDAQNVVRPHFACPYYNWSLTHKEVAIKTNSGQDAMWSEWHIAGCILQLVLPSNRKKITNIFHMIARLVPHHVWALCRQGLMIGTKSGPGPLAIHSTSIIHASTPWKWKQWSGWVDVVRALVPSQDFT